MKRFLLFTSLLGALNVAAQDPNNPFAEAFEGMFQLEEPDWIESAVNDSPPDPPVPLDGGLTALLAAGAAVGYRRFRARRVPKDSNP